MGPLIEDKPASRIPKPSKFAKRLFKPRNAPLLIVENLFSLKTSSSSVTREESAKVGTGERFVETSFKLMRLERSWKDSLETLRS